MIITIDGPAGAGKSSAAKALARRLNFDYLDTGAMYRAVTLAALRAGIDLHDQKALTHLVAGLRLELSPGRVFLNGEEITSLIRTQDITTASGPIADSPVVRRFLGEQQRAIAKGLNLICEGRDQGTVVFPDADCKFFLIADPAERARRRHQEMAARGEPLSLEQVFHTQENRDRRDAARDLAPMVPAADAILLDSTHLSQEETVERMVAEIRLRKGAPG